MGLAAGCLLGGPSMLVGCSGGEAQGDSDATSPAGQDVQADSAYGTLQEESTYDRGFVVDDVLAGSPAGDVHFSLHVPGSYDGSSPYALYVHCPGWEGLWFQGVGANLQEDFAFVANDYVEDMIVASPQLDDWGDTSAEKAIALTRWLIASYNIDASRVYLSGYSGGGETISIVMGMHPELYRRAPHMSSKWDGDQDALVAARVPVRMSIGESDDYYGSDPVREAYEQIRQKYADAGLSEDEINELLVLDVKPGSHFDGIDAAYGQHGGGAALFPHDEGIMGWLFG